jgi:hypothetical protein
VRRKLTSIGISNAQERKFSEFPGLVLLLTAEVVDAQLETYVHTHVIEPVFGTHERFLFCITPESNATAMSLWLLSGRPSVITSSSFKETPDTPRSAEDLRRLATTPVQKGLGRVLQAT